jgi:hypothetical protein
LFCRAAVVINKTFCGAQWPLEFMGIAGDESNIARGEVSRSAAR